MTGVVCLVKAFFSLGERPSVLDAHRGKDMEKQLVDREVQRNRFRRLFTNSRPQMPEGHQEDVRVVSTRQLIREQRECQA